MAISATPDRRRNTRTSVTTQNATATSGTTSPVLAYSVRTRAPGIDATITPSFESVAGRLASTRPNWSVAIDVAARTSGNPWSAVQQHQNRVRDLLTTNHHPLIESAETEDSDFRDAADTGAPCGPRNAGVVPRRFTQRACGPVLATVARDLR